MKGKYSVQILLYPPGVGGTRRVSPLEAALTGEEPEPPRTLLVEITANYEHKGEAEQIEAFLAQLQAGWAQESLARQQLKKLEATPLEVAN